MRIEGVWHAANVAAGYSEILWSLRHNTALADDLVAIYIATQARRSLMGDRLAGVAAILLAGLCGFGPWVIFWMAEMFPWQ